MTAWKRAAHVVGGALAIGGAVFMVVRLREHSGQIDLVSLTGAEWLTFAGLLLINVTMIFLLTMAWREALRGGGAKVSLRWAFGVYGMTQLARYVPGNIFHFAGRQMIGMAAGVPGLALAKASATELLLLLLAGSVTALLAAPLMAPSIGVWPGPWVALVFALGIWTWLRLRGRQAFANAFLAYLVYMLLSAVIFVCVVIVHGGGAHLTWSSLIPLGAAYVAGWLVGLVTPGAPAGLGVREVVLVLLLKGQMDENVLLFAVLITRILAIVADVLCFTAAVLLRRHTRYMGDA